MIVKPKYALSSLSENDFERISKFILKNYGINLTSNKKQLVEYRLQKRLQKLNLESYNDYIKYLFSKEGQENETIELVNEISTNKTDFFRENQHFTILKDKILPTLAKEYRSKIMPVWSAGCSSGEEVYTLAITMENFGLLNPEFQYCILGTDISENVISHARRAIYPIEAIKPIPERDLKRYFLKSKNPLEKRVRVKKELREKTQFNFLNLMDNEYATPHIYPIIFCRNTLIYFDKENKRKILTKLHSRLRLGGYLFISHTESLVSMSEGFRLVYPSVYQKVGN